MIRPGRALLLGYVALLGISHLVRALTPDERPLPPGTDGVEVRAVSADRLLERTVRLAYLDTGTPTEGRNTPILLLHGSPGTHHDFDAALPVLRVGRRVLAPDLPGFGASTRDVPDYSIRAHARYALQLLDRLGIERVDVVGFSMGGGVAIDLYGIAPERVRSVTLLSSIGVQELELFGDYRLNHLVHAGQVGLFWLAREGLPHMGLLDRSLFSLGYARNFLDSDQRPLRGILERLRPPTLILHGDRDDMVPAAAAREHHRLVPQSRLEWFHGGHFLLFTRGEAIGGRIVRFLDEVDGGVVPSRGAAAPERIAAAAAPFDPTTMPPFTGVALVLMGTLIALATLVSEDFTCIAVGLLVAKGRIAFLPAVVACAAGIFIGDLLLFLAGRLIGRPALGRAPLRYLVTPDRVESSSRWFARRGPVVILLSRFTPGTRLPLYFASGMLRTSFWRFAFYFAIAVVLWTPLLVGAAMLVGARALAWFESFRTFALPALVAAGLVVFLAAKIVPRLFTYRGRRLLVGRFRRLRHWEFWPPWAVYPPIVLYIAWLGLRHRSPLLFTACNPAMPASGFISEPKHEILRGLGAAGDRVARATLLPAGESAETRFDRLTRFLRESAIDYPVVLKPDTGQRGSGVAIVHDEGEARAYLEAAGFDALVQEYAPGHEFGIFYYRMPGAERGEILSVTEKRMPVVVGDGVGTLERLILADPRAVCMASHYFRVQADRLGDVPRVGEETRLVELGTHCRGAVFLDGSRVLTDDLANEIDRISRGFRGFYFGRYDLRAPDLDELRRGRGFKIVELNGVTSEATHVYDPAVGIGAAYRVLFRQWRIAFEIGARNRERGIRPARPGELLRGIEDYLASSRTHPA